MVALRESAFTDPAMFQADVMTVDKTWMPIRDIGHTRPIIYDIKNGGWISVLKARGSGTIQRHRHAAPVTAFTIDGAWGYREHDWVARAGSFVYEPAGHIHTLYIDPEASSMTAVFHVSGPLAYVDADGTIEDYEDVFVRIERYKAYCSSVGLGDDWIRSLIR